MKFVPMKTLLDHALAEGYAVPSFCVWNAETMDAVLQTCDRLRAPVILMSSSYEFEVLRPSLMADVAREVAKSYNIPVALHVDHGNSVDLIEEAIDAGYTSVMLDYSSKPFEENVSALQKVIKLAHPKGITVEGEIGHVGKADAFTVEGDGDSTLTTPQDAIDYVSATGVDALAISIGNAHGQYTHLPKLDFERLAEIHAAVKIPLVLHGGSGTPDADLKRVISLGMAKINIATDIVMALRQSLQKQWQDSPNKWISLTVAQATSAMIPAIEKWVKLTGASGRN